MTSETERLIDSRAIERQKLDIEIASRCDRCALSELCDDYDTGLARCERYVEGSA